MWLVAFKFIIQRTRPFSLVKHHIGLIVRAWIPLIRIHLAKTIFWTQRYAKQKEPSSDG